MISMILSQKNCTVNFFNADQGLQGWIDAVEKMSFYDSDSDSVKRLLKQTLPGL